MEFLEIGIVGFAGLKVVHIGYAIYNYITKNK